MFGVHGCKYGLNNQYRMNEKDVVLVGAEK